MDRETEELLARLERLAKEIDAQQYPGEAWSLPSAPPPRRRVWKMASLVAVAAASITVLVYSFGMRQTQEQTIPVGPTIADRNHESSNNTLEEVSVIPIVVMEDHDSYSFIDLTADVPLVSFANKDTYIPECVVPLLSYAATELPPGQEITN
jgi:hypothetical protein